MGFTAAEKDEVRQMIDDYLEPVGKQVESLTVDSQLQRETMETLAKALERLSLVVVGDDELKIVGHATKIDVLEKHAAELDKSLDKKEVKTMIENTKIVWFVIGAALVINVIFRILPWGWTELFKLLAPHP